MNDCTHEVLPLTAPIAQRCGDCDNLRPLVPATFGEPIVLTENGAYAKSDYDAMVAAQEERKIVSVTIGPATGNYGSATATAVFDDGSTGEVLSWYDDELTFSQSDFIGLTQKAVRQLFHERDIAYIQS